MKRIAYGSWIWLLCGAVCLLAAGILIGRMSAGETVRVRTERPAVRLFGIRIAHIRALARCLRSLTKWQRKNQVETAYIPLIDGFIAVLVSIAGESKSNRHLSYLSQIGIMRDSSAEKQMSKKERQI